MVVLFCWGERIIKVLFEFTCYFSLHIIFLGGVILQKEIKGTYFESSGPHCLFLSSHTPSILPPSPLMGRLSREIRESCKVQVTENNATAIGRSPTPGRTVCHAPPS